MPDDLKLKLTPRACAMASHLTERGCKDGEARNAIFFAAANLIVAAELDPARDIDLDEVFADLRALVDQTLLLNRPVKGAA